MTVYYIVTLAVIAILFMDERIFAHRSLGESRPSKFGMFATVVLLAVVAGLRYDIGTDYQNYYANYSYFKIAPLTLNDEPGIKVIARVASWIYDDPATMLFIAAAITVTLMVITVMRNSDMAWISILLYLFLGPWHGCFNGVRQYLAAAILFAGHCFIKERKFIRWLLIVLLACMFHVTAIMGILFYFFPRIKINLKNLLISIVCIFVGMMLYDVIFDLIGFLKSDTFDFEGEGSGYLITSINPLRIAVAWVPVVFFYVFRKAYNTEDPKFHFYFNMTTLHAILMTTAINSTYLGRVGIYTNIFNTITWPLLLKPLSKSNKIIIVLCMLVLFFIYWNVEISGDTLRNFQWIFNR